MDFLWGISRVSEWSFSHVDSNDWWLGSNDYILRRLGSYYCIGVNEARAVYPCAAVNAIMKADVRVKKVIEDVWSGMIGWNVYMI